MANWSRRLLIVVAICSAATPFHCDARQPRSKAEIAAFQRTNPCPSTGAPRGPCPGYQVDHRRPLKCGGPDRPENMQWLTAEEHKLKTKRESRLCRKRGLGA